MQNLSHGFFGILVIQKAMMSQNRYGIRTFWITPISVGEWSCVKVGGGGWVGVGGEQCQWLKSTVSPWNLFFLTMIMINLQGIYQMFGVLGEVMILRECFIIL